MLIVQTDSVENELRLLVDKLAAINGELSSSMNQQATDNVDESMSWETAGRRSSEYEYASDAAVEAFLVADHHPNDDLQPAVTASPTRYPSFFESDSSSDLSLIEVPAATAEQQQPVIPSLQVYTLARTPIAMNMSVQQGDDTNTKEEVSPAIAENVVVSLVPHEIWGSLKEEVHVTFNNSSSMAGAAATRDASETEVLDEVREAVKQRQSKTKSKVKRKRVS
jgi:hypothetical protein